MLSDFLDKFQLKFSSSQQKFNEISQNYAGLHLKCQLFLIEFNQTCIFLTVFITNPQHKIERKSVQSETSLPPRPPPRTRTAGRTKRRTDMTNLAVVFRNFANAPNKYFVLRIIFTKITCLWMAFLLQSKFSKFFSVVNNTSSPRRPLG
jgi:hypothetical protein